VVLPNIRKHTSHLMLDWFCNLNCHNGMLKLSIDTTPSVLIVRQHILKIFISAPPHFSFSLLGISGKGQELAKDTATDSHEEHEHKKRKEPKWLLILEVATGVFVFVFLVSCVVAFKRWKPKSSVIIPWKRTTTWKDQITISIG